MNGTRANHPVPEKGGNVLLYQVLAQTMSTFGSAIEKCCVPLQLTQPLVSRLLQSFEPEVDASQFWRLLGEFGLSIQQSSDEWRLDSGARRFFLDQFEQRDRDLAQRIHSEVLRYLETQAVPTLDQIADQDRALVQRAYHTVPSNPDEGARLYWSAYCRTRTSSRFAMLPVLAHLSGSQAHWLPNHNPFIQLYRAAAHYYQGSADSRQKASAILVDILEKDPPVPVRIDASFLLGMITEQSDRDEARELYEACTEMRDDLDLRDESPEGQHHLRLTLAKSFFNLASALGSKGDPEEMDEAEAYYRYGIQIAQGIPEAEYEAGPTRHLLALLQKRGRETEVLPRIERGGESEKPAREEFLEGALKRALVDRIDTGYLYYAMAAYHHRSAYEKQRIDVQVNDDGSARVEGIYTLMALSILDQTDTYLEPSPDSSPEEGIRFETVDSMTPGFALRFIREGKKGKERLAIAIDPPMKPGERLTFHWAAAIPPGTFETAPGKLIEGKPARDRVAWEIIAPIERLEITVLLPYGEVHATRAWFEFWRVGTWHTAGQSKALYRAFLKDDPSMVKCNVEPKPPAHQEYSLRVNYPCLALQYVLYWEVM